MDSVGTPVAWEVIPEFDVSQLDHADLSLAFGVGFAVVGTGLIIAKIFRAALQIFKDM